MIGAIFRKTSLLLTLSLTILVGVVLLLLFNIQNNPQSAHWSTVIEHAQRIAQEIEPESEAIPMELTVMKNESVDDDQTESFRYVWYFFRPSTRQGVMVEIDDTDINNIETAVGDIESAHDALSDPNPYLISVDEQQQRKQAFASIRISPGEAFRLAKEAGTPFGDQATFLGLNLWLDPTVEERIGVPVVWSAVAIGRPGEGKRHVIWIDATNGTILGRTDDNTSIPTAEPPNTDTEPSDDS